MFFLSARRMRSRSLVEVPAQIPWSSFFIANAKHSRRTGQVPQITFAARTKMLFPSVKNRSV